MKVLLLLYMCIGYSRPTCNTCTRHISNTHEYRTGNCKYIHTTDPPSYIVVQYDLCCICFRYLATGCSFRSLHYEYLIGRATIADIVADTCAALWNVLRDECMKQPTTEDWLRISKTFAARADYPHCCGAVDGKHVRIISPSHSGSDFFNHKRFFSIVLMAVADANYCFTCIDVGAYGKESDSNVLKNTVLGQRIYTNSLNLPQPKPLCTDTDSVPVPYMFVADEAFALAENVMRPYPGRNLTHERRIFNYRLSRARRFVECAFGILANKWRIFHRPIDVSCDFADTIIKACCVLHNFVRQRDGYNFEDTHVHWTASLLVVQEELPLD